MRSSEICALAIQIALWRYGEVQYRIGNTTTAVSTPYNNMTWLEGAWHSDCLGFVRACLCGWNADKTVDYGGSSVATQQCGWFNENMFIDTGCTYQSTDFTELRQHPCSLLVIDGTHVGLYVGEFEANGHRYNTCEVTTSYGWGARPAWVYETGQRAEYEGASGINYWDRWGVFDTSGAYFDPIVYDGGADGFTGFGAAYPDKESFLKAWNDLPPYPSNIDYAYLEQLAYDLYGIPANCFEIIAGWTRTEMYFEFSPYMGYLCGCIPLNGYMGHGIHTPQGLAQFVGGTDPVYTPQLFHEVCQDLINNPEGYYNELKGLFLVLMNPNQLVRGCSGMDTVPQEDIIYQEVINGYLITAWKLPNAEDYTYDITGIGYPGGNPNAPLNPAGKVKLKMPAWMYLRQYYNYTRNRRKNLWY